MRSRFVVFVAYCTSAVLLAGAARPGAAQTSGAKKPAAASPAPAASAPTASYDDLTAQAEDALQKGQPAAALDAALAATRLNPARHEGYYLAGVAMYKQDDRSLDGAEKFIRLALDRAPADKRELYNSLLKVMADKRVFLAHAQDGDAALDAGLAGKAAAEYTAAWKLFPMRDDMGLKAAHVWADRLHSPLSAAPILNYIAGHSKDADRLGEAKALLQTLQPDLQKIYDENMASGQHALEAGPADDALKALNTAALAMPGRQEPHLMLARFYAKQNDFNNTTKEVAAAVKAGPLDVEQGFNFPEFAGLLADPKFQTFIGDALGPEALEKAKGVAVAMEQAKRAAIAAAEQAKRDAEAQEKARQELAAEEAAEMAAPRQTKINPRDGAKMIYIPAGRFYMGSAAAPYEYPRHTVQLDGYWIYETPVTVAQYDMFLKATRHRTRGVLPVQATANDPIVGVLWEDAVAYCQWAGTRLPTEAEWEKAARGIDGRTFPWGNIWDATKTRPNLGGRDLGQWYCFTLPVGSYPQGASPFGCLDMVGNIWQWCADWFDAGYYTKEPSVNPSGPLAGNGHAIRGGLWFPHEVSEFNSVDPRVHLDGPIGWDSRNGYDPSNSINFRTSIRFGYPVDSGWFELGFRCAASP